TKDNALVANLLTNLSDSHIGKLGHRPVTCAATDLVKEVTDKIDSLLRVIDLRVELETKESLFRVFNRRKLGVFRGRDRLEPCGCLDQLVTMRVPYPDLITDAGKQSTLLCL